MEKIIEILITTIKAITASAAIFSMAFILLFMDFDDFYDNYAEEKLRNLGESSPQGISFYPADEILDSEWTHICTLGPYGSHAVYQKNNLPKDPQVKMLAEYAIKHEISNDEADWTVILIDKESKHYPINRSATMDYPSPFDLKNYNPIKKLLCKERNGALIGVLKNQRTFFFISEK